MFEFLFCIATLFIPDVCKPCDGNKIVTDHIVSSIVGQANCGGYDAMKPVIEKAVAKVNYCSKESPSAEGLPSGTWTASGIVCYHSVNSLNLTKFPNEWLCKPSEKFKFNMILEDCQRLE